MGRTAKQAIGYKELYPYFAGERTLDECVEQLKMQTRRYAKRQLTWFRRDERIKFLYIDDYDTPDGLLNAALAALRGVRMKQKGILIKVLSVLAAFIIFGYFAVQIYEMIGRNYATRTAYIQTVTDSVDAEMFVIRDEVILDSGGSGVIVPIAVNGERVSRGSEIAASFPSEQSAENYSLLRNLNKSSPLIRR